MYNTKYVCTYESSEHLTDDKISEYEKQHIQDVLYREDLLSVFDIEEYDDTTINYAIHDVFEQIKTHVELKLCMTKLANSFMSTDEEMGLVILYSFDYFYLTHLCVSELLDTGKISQENMDNLKKLVL